MYHTMMSDHVDQWEDLHVEFRLKHVHTEMTASIRDPHVYCVDQMSSMLIT